MFQQITNPPKCAVLDPADIPADGVGFVRLNDGKLGERPARKVLGEKAACKMSHDDWLYFQRLRKRRSPTAKNAARQAQVRYA